MKKPLLKKDEKVLCNLIYSRIRDLDGYIKATLDRIASGKYNVPANEKLLHKQHKQKEELIKIYAKF